MFHTIRCWLLPVVPSLVLLLPAPTLAQQPKPPNWAYAFDLACRKLGEQQFTKDTKKWGFEVFKDNNTNLGVYLCQSGAVGVVSGFENLTPPLKDSKAPDWTAGLDLKARKAGEEMFTKDTKTYSMEVFYDVNRGNWVYITEHGNIAVCPGKKPAGGELKAPKWMHSVDLKVRKAGMKEWKDAHAYGLEIYRDENNGNLIYITDTGFISVVPPMESSTEPKAPDWMHGQDLQCRKYGEKVFSKDTRKYGLEIFRDANNGNWIVICETGSIAVLPGNKSAKAPTPDPKDGKFQHGLDLACRQAGEKDFTEKTRIFAHEIYREDNIGAFIYLSETGVIAATAAKQ